MPVSWFPPSECGIKKIEVPGNAKQNKQTDHVGLDMKPGRYQKLG